MIKACENCGNSYLGDLESCPYCGFTPNKDIPLLKRAERIARMKRRASDFFVCCGYFIVTVLCIILVFFFLIAFSASIPDNLLTDVVFSIILTSFPFMVAYRTWLKRTSDYTSTRYVSGFLTIIFSSFPSLLLFFIDQSLSLETNCDSFIEIALPMLISLAAFRFIRYRNNSKICKKQERKVKVQTSNMKHNMLIKVVFVLSIVVSLCVGSFAGYIFGSNKCIIDRTDSFLVDANKGFRGDKVYVYLKKGYAYHNSKRCSTESDLCEDDNLIMISEYEALRRGFFECPDCTNRAEYSDVSKVESSVKDVHYQLNDIIGY